MRISLRNRLALIFSAITLLAIGSLYLYVAPGLRGRLIENRLYQLKQAAERYSEQIAATARAPISRAQIRSLVQSVSVPADARVTLFAVADMASPPGPRLSLITDSEGFARMQSLGMGTALSAARRGRLVTGTDNAAAGPVAEAAYPISYHGRVERVILFSSPVNVARDVTLIRNDILVAGGIALALALVGGYLVARWLAARVKRLELAAEGIAAGEFPQPIEIDHQDELGQLARAFNSMQRQLSLLDRARKQFIATASHELRTPVFSLGGFVELLEDEDLDADTRRRFLEQVKAQVERLRKLSVDLLDLSRLESGSLELRPESVDLGEVARSVAAEFEPSLASRDAHLELRLGASAEADCDPVRIAQITRILIDNALTHTPPGVRIVVSTARDNGIARVEVRDNGEGIDRETLQRIFEPFFSGDDAQGSGLGLAIASELAERMSGRLRVRTSAAGTTFTLEIPAQPGREVS
jgi:two-component system OmpR family sensor kinase